MVVGKVPMPQKQFLLLFCTFYFFRPVEPITPSEPINGEQPAIPFFTGIPDGGCLNSTGNDMFESKATIYLSQLLIRLGWLFERKCLCFGNNLNIKQKYPCSFVKKKYYFSPKQIRALTASKYS